VRSGCPISSIELAENIAGDERVIHVTAASQAALTDRILDDAAAAGQLTGCSGRTADGTLRTSGVPVVSDPLRVLTEGRAASGALQRHAESFFQTNRFLLPRLVTTVLDAVRAENDVLDLYAGVGLFSIALVATGRRGVTAVEGDRTSGADLLRNAAANGASVRVAIGRVEDQLWRWKGAPASTLVVDPPRTGISKEAMRAIAGHGAARVVYVSCDPPTMARDARRLLDGGYRFTSIRGFDLFPNTPHVECVGVFDLDPGGIAPPPP
jgi:tRNA/tmRNA/rRNA uracil-C5-methylase (TrmA/RlmC/RlmD family)